MEIALSPEASARTRSYEAGSPEIREALETYDLHILRVGHWLAFRGTNARSNTITRSATEFHI